MNNVSTNGPQGNPPVETINDPAVRLTPAEVTAKLAASTSEAKIKAAINVQFHAEPIIERLIAIAAGHGGQFALCAFGDGMTPSIGLAKNSGDPAFLMKRFADRIAKIAQTPGMNTYIVPALIREDLPQGSRGKESDVTGVLAVVLDFDAGHDPATRHERLPIYPHAEVETSPGNFQIWYFLDHPYSVAEVKPVIAALVNKAGADACGSCDHPFRVPGTLNWPNNLKISRGRSPEPVLAMLTVRPDVCDVTTLDDLKAAIVAKWPDTTFDAQRAKIADADFDWGQRRAAGLNSLSDAEIIAALNDPKWSDRSAGVWAFINLEMRRGHSPDEIVTLMLDHTDTLCMGHYHDPVEDGVRADVKRAFEKVEEPKPSVSDTFKDTNLGSIRDVIDLRNPDSVEIGEADAEAWYAELNKRFAVVQYGSKVMIARTDGDEISFFTEEDFHRMFSHRFISVMTKAGEAKLVSLTKSWFKWEPRREYVNPGVKFLPGEPLEVPGKMLNLWRGFSIEPQQGDWSLLRAHIRDVVCSGNRIWDEYFIKWMAACVQQIDQSINTAIVLKGDEGSGKGVVFRTIGNCFGQHFAHVTQGDQLTGRFNAAIADKLPVFMDEALWANDRKAENVLKGLITEGTVTIERKYQDPIKVDSRIRLMIASNNDWVVPVSKRDRRYFILNVPDTYVLDRVNDDPEITARKEAYWKALYAGGRKSEVAVSVQAAMLYDLLRMDLTGFDVRNIPATAAKTEQARHSLKGTEAWLNHVLHEGTIGSARWGSDGLLVDKDTAYEDYRAYSAMRREWRPEDPNVWARLLYKAMMGVAKGAKSRAVGRRTPAIAFASLMACRSRFENYMRAEPGSMGWDAPPDDE